MSQVEKFKMREAKRLLTEEIQDKGIEKVLAVQLEERNQELKSIDILSNTITIQSKEIDYLRKSREEDRGILLDMQAKLDMLLSRSPKTEVDVKIEFIMHLHSEGKFLGKDELHALGLEMWPTALHRHRAMQIKEQGFFVDPVDWGVVKLPQTRKSKEWLIPPTVEEPKTVGQKRGPKPKRIKEAMAFISEHTTATGRYQWEKGGFELVCAVLSIAEYVEGIDIYNVKSIEKSNDARSAYQAVTYHKDRYGIKTWADLMSKYDAAKRGDKVTQHL